MTDPLRVREIAEEFQRRLAYLEHSYEFSKAQAADSRSFNRSLVRLKKALAEPVAPKRRKTRLNPMLEIMINHLARKFAGVPPEERLVACHVEFVDRAAREVAAKVRSVRGRPASERVRHHAEALMALIQETCGKPVLAYRDADEVPRLAEGVSQLLLLMFSRMDPDVTETQLFNIVRRARRAYAGKPMRFRDFFPLYGAQLDPATLAPIARLPFQVLHFELAAPIYCP